MKLITLKIDEKEAGGVATCKGIVTLEAINKGFNTNWENDLFSLIDSGQLDELNKWYIGGGKKVLDEWTENVIPFEKAKYGPLYREPKKIFGIGLNYAEHAADLAERAPDTEPASFFKPATTIIGCGDDIKIPLQSENTTGEAELGIIIGKTCVDVKEENWLDYVAGFTTIIDMTAEDILRKNPRYLTRSKSFETFFSFGPQLVTPDEIEDVLKLNVATVINGNIHAQNTVNNMTFKPDFLVSFHSKVMKLLPGDIISTGTPRAVHIAQGDVVECRIDGFESLVNPVIDKKINK
nr:fumarylacetoacetate hydrolase family protein [Sedimentibacter sp.]